MDRGALGAVLQFSRVAGVAPFHRNGDYRVSSPLVICAKLFIMITVVCYMIFTATISVWTQKYETMTAFDIIRWTTKLFVIIAAFVSVFTSSERTLRLIRFLKELDELDNQILGDYRPNIKERKLTILVLTYLHVSLVIRFYHTFHPFDNIGKISFTSLHSLIILSYYMVNLSEVQLILFAKKILMSLKLINDGLEKLYYSQSRKDIAEIHNIIKKVPILAWVNSNEVKSINEQSTPDTIDKTRPEKIQEPVKFIRQCVANYMHICEIITTSTDGDGLFIAILMMCYLLHLMLFTYQLIVYAITPEPYTFEPTLVLVMYWFVIYSVTLVAFVEPIHKTQSEMQRLHLLLTSLMLKNIDKENIHNELLLFLRVINLNKPTYAPLGLFNINRTLILKIFGSLITYLVIIVTYGPETRKPSSPN